MTEHHRENNGQAHQHERSSDPLLAEILAAVRSQASKIESIQGSINRMTYDLATTREAVERMDVRQDKQDNNLTRHMEVEEVIIKDAVDRIEVLAKGFPKDPDSGERDPQYHARWHETDIKKWKDKSELMKKIRDYIAIAIVGVLATGVGAILLSGTKVEVKRVMTEEVRK